MTQTTTQTKTTKTEKARQALNASLLAVAAEFGSPVAFSYSNLDGSKTAVRSVYPKRLVEEPTTKGNRGAYIIGIDIDAGEQRTFSISAISGTVFVGQAPAA